MEQKKPKIAMICTRRWGYDKPPHLDYDEMSLTYIHSVLGAGGLPYLIPIDFPLENLSELREMFDGLLLIGGGDIAIERYGGKAHPSVGDPVPERDEIEIRLAKMAFESGWPVFGVCRGEQLMNVVGGGKLYSDIPDQVPEARFLHSQPISTPRNALIHEVNVSPDTLLHRILGKDVVSVNTFHHQAVSVPAEGFIVNAVSEDGIIEGIELPGHPFALGVQWHPECLQEYEVHRALFRAFVDACR